MQHRIRAGRALLILALASAAPARAERPQSAAPASQPPAQSAAAGSALPGARDIMDRHLKAIGGREAMLARSSTRATGTISMPAAGVTGTFEMFAAKPNKMLVRMTLPGVGESQEGFDGTVGWTINPLTGPSLIQGVQLEQRKLESDFYSVVSPERQYESMTTVEKTTFDGRACYKIRLVRRGGGEDFQFYDSETGLRAGSITTRETPMGPMTATSVEGDYKRFGAILYATRLTSNIMNLQQIITIDSFEFDKVDPAVFELPAQIKALTR